MSHSESESEPRLTLRWAIVQSMSSILLSCVFPVIWSPLEGILVRYRANYTPPGPRVNGYFSMMNRIAKLEGSAGFFKGLVPYILFNFLSAVFGTVYTFIHVVSPASLSAPQTNMTMHFINLILFDIIINVPSSILVYRAYCTPYNLPISSKHSLAVLLSPTERREPWKIYFGAKGGLLLIKTIIFGCHRFSYWWLFGEGDYRVELSDVNKLIACAISVLFLSALLVPLDVLYTRLVLQRNHSFPRMNDDSITLTTFEDSPSNRNDTRTFVRAVQRESEAQNAAKLKVKKYSEELEVIGLRDESDPYNSLYDCFVRIRREEGWKVFYRAFWITLLHLSYPHIVMIVASLYNAGK